MNKFNANRSLIPVTRSYAVLILRTPGQFTLRVLQEFRRNQGLLLAGAVAYYTLLSIVPLFALILVALSHVVDQEQLLRTISTHLDLLLPGQSDMLTKQIILFFEHREVVGRMGVFILLFFSSMAFTVLENAMAVIFLHRTHVHRRHFLVSAILPYLYILLLGVGILLVTLISGALQTMEYRTLAFLGYSWSLAGTASQILYMLGFSGLVLMLTSLYLVMPVGRLALRHAFIGGLTAALLWEVARHFLVWYFSTISFVSVVYGSLATAIIALVSLEVAAIILLLGAQVIAEFERSVQTHAKQNQDSLEEWPPPEKD